MFYEVMNYDNQSFGPTAGVSDLINRYVDIPVHWVFIFPEPIHLGANAHTGAWAHATVSFCLPLVSLYLP